MPELGWCLPTQSVSLADPAATQTALADLSQSWLIIGQAEQPQLASVAAVIFGGPSADPQSLPLQAVLPALPPDSLGDPYFREAHGLKYAYMTGAMANGIGSVEIVEAMSHAGMLGSFGAAGLSIERCEQAISRLQQSLGSKPYCVNLIHSPNEPAHEAAMVDLLLRRQVRLIEASAYLDLTPSVVRYRLQGLQRKSDGSAMILNKIIAKVSRTEVATRFLSPAPARMIQELLATRQITAEQAELAPQVPMCDDLTAEADSGGHTDNRPAIALLPALVAVRDRLQSQYGYTERPRVGLAGGIATPTGVAAAFALGASYIVTGSINQACRESGSSDVVRKMLADAAQADVTMAPAADMFEMGVKVQVLKRGTMFAMRGQKLLDLYRQYSSWEAIPEADRVQVEKNFFRRSFAEIWQETHEFFSRRDPTQLPKAESDPKHKMALVFRWYLGLSSRWANSGEASRQLDFQVWCGPAMGAFNEWTKGSFLESPEHRTVTLVAKNLLYGAALHLRKHSVKQSNFGNLADLISNGPWTEAELAPWFL